MAKPRFLSICWLFQKAFVITISAYFHTKLLFPVFGCLHGKPFMTENQHQRKTGQTCPNAVRHNTLTHPCDLVFRWTFLLKGIIFFPSLLLWRHSQDLPEVFENNMAQWMEGFHTYLTSYSNPLMDQPEGSEAAGPVETVQVMSETVFDLSRCALISFRTDF